MHYPWNGPENVETRPAVTITDIYEVPRLAVQGFLAWTLPEPVWWPISRLFGYFNAAMNPAQIRKETAVAAAVLAGTPAASEAHRAVVENRANRYEMRFQYLRA